MIKITIILFIISGIFGWIGGVIGNFIISNDYDINQILFNPFFFLIELPVIVLFPIVYVLYMKRIIKKYGDHGASSIYISGFIGLFMVILNPLTLIIFPIAILFSPIGFIIGYLIGLVAYRLGILEKFKTLNQPNKRMHRTS